MTELVAYLVSGVALGSSFALIGSGFVVVHRVTRVVNFAQGSLAVVGGMVSATLLDGLLPHGLGEVVAVLSVVGGAARRAAGRRPPRHTAADLLDRHPRRLDADLCGDHLAVGPGPGLAARPGRLGSTILGATVERQRLLVLVGDTGGVRGSGPVLLPVLRRQGTHRQRVQPVRGPDGRHRRPPDGTGRVRPGRGARWAGRRLGRPHQCRVVLLRPAAGTQRIRCRRVRRSRRARSAPWWAVSAWALPAS